MKTNCENFLKIEGHVYDINFRKDKVKPDRSILSFTLYSGNTDGKKVYPMPTEVFVYDKKADIVASKIDIGDLVQVTGKLRHVNGKGKVAIADHVHKSETQYGMVMIDVKHKEDSND